MTKFSLLFFITFSLDLSISLSLSAQVNELVLDKNFEVNVFNPSALEREEVLVLLSEKEIFNKFADFNTRGFIVFLNGIEIPSQFIASGSDAGIAVVIPKIGPKEDLKLQVSYHTSKNIDRIYPKRTQAELSHKINGHFENREYIGGEFQNVTELHVPKEHTDHSWFIRYEGPGWESDKVGYRFYLDWRNGVDVFGKKVSEPILQLVGQDGFDSYHEMQDWGMDVLKVAKSLGVGSIATFEDGVARRVDKTDSLYASVLNNGPVYSSILTKYHGWDLKSGKTTLTSNISIHAGTRLTKQVLSSSDHIENFATGLIKDPKAELMIGAEDQEYGYLATYGKQSLNNDNLGIAVFFPNSQKISITEDPNSHIVVLNPVDREITYFFAAAWELEKDGIKNKKEFEDYLKSVTNALSNPIKISIIE